MPGSQKRKYEELKIKGPPLYRQGAVANFDGTKIIDSPEVPTLPLEASRTALLIVDVQPEYWSECPAVRKDFDSFPSKISSLIQNCRAEGAKCIWVRADYSYDRSPWLQQFSRLHKGRIPPVVKPNSKWEKFAEPADGELTITKTSWSSTTDTGLVDTLNEAGIETVLVCGLITSVCVQHSAFGVFEAGFRTILVTDACADRGKERHEAALALYGDYMYELRTVKSVENELEGEGERISFDLEPSCLIKSNSQVSMTTLTSHTGSLSSLDEQSDDVE